MPFLITSGDSDEVEWDFFVVEFCSLLLDSLTTLRGRGLGDGEEVVVGEGIQA